MTKSSKDDVYQKLAPFHARIRAVIERGFGEWKLVQALRTEKGLAPVMYDRTKSNDIFDAVARYAIAEFAADDAVQMKIESQTVKFFFGGAVLARFKKADENGLGCNIPTQAALAFADADAMLPGMSRETAKVEFTWRPNEIWTSIESVNVVARDGDVLLWEYEIPGAGEVTFLVPSPVPGKSPNVEAPLITPKAKPSKKSEAE